MAFEERLLVGRRQIAIVRQALVVGVRHQVEDVFLEVGAGAADRVHLAGRIISASDRPNSAVLIAPASVTNMRPP